jgi:DNA-directed RNA polymerase specialized sigma24 family protein
MEHGNPPRSSGAFPTTSWGFIQAAQDRDDSQYVAAVNRFVAAYWKPVFCFLRAKGYGLHQAEDLAQEFFLRFLERDWLVKADPKRGRFRSFLLKILIRFLSDQGPRRSPRQKAFEGRFISIEGLLGDEDRSYEPPRGETAEAVFDRQWAAALVSAVRARLRQVCQEKGRGAWCDLFDAAHAAGADSEAATQQALAYEFGMTRDQVRYALGQVQQWFVILLRGEVADQVGPGADVDQEIRELLLLLGPT